MASVERKKKKDIDAILKKLDKFVEVGMKRWALSVVDDAVEHALILSGQLRRSITHSDVVKRYSRFEITVGPDITVKDYARRQEFDESLGFGPISQSEGATRPWLRFAFEQNKQYGRILLMLAVKRAFR